MFAGKERNRMKKWLPAAAAIVVLAMAAIVLFRFQSAEPAFAFTIDGLAVETEFSEDQLRQVYKQNLPLFTYDVGVAVLAAELSPETPGETVEHILLRMGEQTDPAQLAQEFPEGSFYRLEMNSLDTQEGRSGAYAARWEIASQMQEGELSGPFDAGGTQMLLRCLSRTENGTLPFETVRGTMESQLQTAAVQEKIREKAAQAEIVCEEDQLRQAALEALGK